MTDPAEMDTPATPGDSNAYAGSFARDTVTWAFAKLAEHTLDHLFSQPGSRERYARWLRDEAPLVRADGEREQGLYLTQIELGCDGHYSVVARPPEGEFILVAHHQEFYLVMASYYDALAPRPEQECVCVAHFEGDAQLAARWASGLQAWLAKQRHPRDTPTPDTTAWTRAAPAKC